MNEFEGCYIQKFQRGDAIPESAINFGNKQTAICFCSNAFDDEIKEQDGLSYEHSFGLVSEYNKNSFGYGGFLSPKQDKDLDDFREFSVLCTTNEYDWIPI